MSGYQIILAGLESVLNEKEFQSVKERVIAAAFESVFLAQQEKRLIWKRGGSELSFFYTETTVKNGRDEDVEVKVWLRVEPEDHRHRCSAVLYLGGWEHSPFLHWCSWANSNPHVGILYRELTGQSRSVS